MREQNSFQADQVRGALYLIPTPIGNLGDMTLRALELLKEVDVIAAEDTRHTLNLCRHFSIQTPIVSYHEHNKKTSGEKLLTTLQDGRSVGLVTDAGTPGISDPGADLVLQCVEKGLPVIPLPGANAAIPALVASGLSTDHFVFYGFLPRRKKDKEATLETLKATPFTLIFYESPHRVKETLTAFIAVFGNRKAALVRELTKRHETFLRGSLEEIRARYADTEIKGECCLIVEGASEASAENEMEWWQDISAVGHVDYYIKIKGLTKKDAIKQTALDRGVPKRDIYNIYHSDGPEEE